MGERLVPWLEDQGWEVFPEVESYPQGPVADLVAVRDEKVWVIEMKKSISLDLLTQAERWKDQTHAVSICTLVKNNQSSRTPRYWRVRSFVEKTLGFHGIGWLSVSCSDSFHTRPVTELVPPVFADTIAFNHLQKILNDGHKRMGIAGSAKAERWSPFKQTVENLKTYLLEHPGATYNEILDQVDHHWASRGTARQCLMKYLRKGVIQGIMVDETQKSHRLYLQ